MKNPFRALTDAVKSHHPMDAQVIHLAPIPVIMLRFTGPYEQVSGTFDRLWTWVTNNNIPVKRSIGIYWDDPDTVPANQLRSAACVEIAFGQALPDPGGLPIEVTSLAGGDYATTRFVGPYEQMAPVWSQLSRYCEHDLRREISDNPAFEVYVNDPSDVPSDQLITELYMPLV